MNVMTEKFKTLLLLKLENLKQNVKIQESQTTTNQARQELSSQQAYPEHQGGNFATIQQQPSTGQKAQSSNFRDLQNQARSSNPSQAGQSRDKLAKDQQQPVVATTMCKIKKKVMSQQAQLQPSQAQQQSTNKYIHLRRVQNQSIPSQSHILSGNSNQSNTYISKNISTREFRNQKLESLSHLSEHSHNLHNNIKYLQQIEQYGNNF